MTSNSFYEEVIIAGFGGQGIMLAGRLLAQTAMKAGKEVTYMPSYGAEVRGGTANCMVVMAERKIASPLVSKPDSLIAMNKASLNKFAPRLKDGGLLVMNSSLIDPAAFLPAAPTAATLPTRPSSFLRSKSRGGGRRKQEAGELADTIEILKVPASELAVELDNPKAANMVALGAYLQRRGLFSADAAANCLGDVLARRYHQTLSVNTKALRRGAKFASGEP